MSNPNEEIFVADAKQSPYDERDWIAEVIYTRQRSIVVLPEEFDLRKDLQLIRSQGGQGTCVAQSCACIKEFQEKKENNIDEHYSPQFIYNLRSTYPDRGMAMRDALKILQKDGCCRERLFLYGTDKDKNTVSREALNDAQKYKITSYAKIMTIEGVKEALYKSGVCVVCFPTYNHTTRFWKPETPEQKQVGGHAVSIVGYNKTGFILRNSWGTKWGDNGYCIYPYTDFGAHWEIWTTIDASSPKPTDDERTAGKCFKLFSVCFGK